MDTIIGFTPSPFKVPRIDAYPRSPRHDVMMRATLFLGSSSLPATEPLVANVAEWPGQAIERSRLVAGNLPFEGTPRRDLLARREGRLMAGSVNPRNRQEADLRQEVLHVDRWQGPPHRAAAHRLRQLSRVYGDFARLSPWSLHVPSALIGRKGSGAQP